MTTGTQNNVVQYVYYYPPEELTSSINSITNIFLDPNTQCVEIQFNYYTLFNVNNTNPNNTSLTTFQQLEASLLIPVDYLEQFVSGNLNTIYVTPQGYINWYNNNLQSLQKLTIYSTQILPMYTTCVSPQGQFSNQNAATAAFISANGYQWITASTFLSTIGSYSTNNNPNYQPFNAVEETDANELYVLVGTGINQPFINGLLPQVSTLDWELLGGAVILLALVYGITR